MKRAAEDKPTGKADSRLPSDQGSREDPSHGQEEQGIKKPRQQSEDSAAAVPQDVSQFPDDNEGDTKLPAEQPPEVLQEAKSEGVGGSSEAQGAETASALAEAPSREESNQPPAVAEVQTRSFASLPFPAQLMNLLQRNVAPDALWFLQGGEAIGINRNTIVEKVLNEHFRGMKFNSLVRNLNRWGFRRISHASLKDNDRGYHHLLFQRDKPHLVHRMKKDSNATEVVRQLDLDATTGEASSSDQRDSSLSAAKARYDANPSEPTHRGASGSLAVAQPQRGGGVIDIPSPRPAQPGHTLAQQGSPGSQRQQLYTHSLAAAQQQHQMDLLRQQQALAAQMGSASAWSGLYNWSFPQTLPSAAPLAFGLPQQGMQPPSLPDQGASFPAAGIPNLRDAVTRTAGQLPEASASDPAEAKGETDEKEDDPSATQQH